MINDRLIALMCLLEQANEKEIESICKSIHDQYLKYRRKEANIYELRLFVERAFYKIFGEKTKLKEI